MKIRLETIIRVSAWATLIFMIVCALIKVIWEIHPPFLDEWAIIYNLKFKNPEQLWHGLDKVQQFPRLYLQIIKQFTSLFNYSYTSIRLPSFIVHISAIFYCVYLSRKLFKNSRLYQYLWVLFYVGYPASTFYFVLLKQYTMEMALGLVAISQLALLININDGKRIQTAKYILLCTSFLVAPMFSYTYPILAAPMYLIVFINTMTKRNKEDNDGVPLSLFKQWIPLSLCAIGIVTLYKTDITQVMEDPGMRAYWTATYMKAFSIKSFCWHIFRHFYLFGRGPFMTFLAVLGIVSWLYASVRSVYILSKKEKSILEWLVVYSVCLMWLTVALFIAKKLPMNAYRLNAFKVPAIGLLIIYLFQQMQQYRKLVKPTYAVAGFLFLLEIIFIVQPVMLDFIHPHSKRGRRIYNNSKTAIAIAQEDKIPVFTTSMTLYDHYDIDKADWVIKSYPAYKKSISVPVYAIESGSDADSLLHQLPYNAAAVTTGDSVWVIKK